MGDRTILEFPPLEEGILLKRYKRFLADVKLKTGKIVTAHCANTGPMLGVLFPGGRVRLRHAPSPTRKLSWTWEQSEVIHEDRSSCWVGVNTLLPNKLVKAAIESDYLVKELGVIIEIRQEVKYGAENRSRIDLLLKPNRNSPDPRQIFLEVKNTTWELRGKGLFPDTITKRGQKHLKELMALMPKSRGVLVPCLSRSDIDAFAPGDEADPLYGKLYRQAISNGLEVIPCCFGFHKDQITWEGIRPICID